MIVKHLLKAGVMRTFRWLPLAAAIVPVFLYTTDCKAQSAAKATDAADFPFLIYCEYEGIHHAYYFSRLGPDGHAIYITPDRQAGMITLDGIAERIGGDRPGTCSGKTLEDLRTSGQAFDVPR